MFSKRIFNRVTIPKNERKIIPTFDPKVQSMSILHTFLFIFTGVSLSQWLLLGILVQKVFETNLNFRYQRVINLKKYSQKVSQLLKLTKQKSFYFFRISYSLARKIEICIKYFLDKNSQNQP